MRVSKLLDSGEKLLAMLYDILSLMSIYIHTFLMADWLKTKLVKPASGSPQRDGTRKIRTKVVAGEKVIVNIFIKHCGSHVRLTLLECMLSNLSGCTTLQVFIRKNTLLLVFSLLHISKLHVVIKELLHIRSDSAFIKFCKIRIVLKKIAHYNN